MLTTNLPVAWDSSVFLRVDESRVDVIKALITGPEGTPYHNGWFVQDDFERRSCLTQVHSYLFDIFLGANYNQQPPSVKYMTVSLCLSCQGCLNQSICRPMGENTASIQLSLL